MSHRQSLFCLIHVSTKYISVDDPIDKYLIDPVHSDLINGLDLTVHSYDQDAPPRLDIFRNTHTHLPVAFLGPECVAMPNILAHLAAHADVRWSDLQQLRFANYPFDLNDPKATRPIWEKAEKEDISLREALLNEMLKRECEPDPSWRSQKQVLIRSTLDFPNWEFESDFYRVEFENMWPSYEVIPVARHLIASSGMIWMKGHFLFTRPIFEALAPYIQLPIYRCLEIRHDGQILDAFTAELQDSKEVDDV